MSQRKWQMTSQRSSTASPDLESHCHDVIGLTLYYDGGCEMFRKRRPKVKVEAIDLNPVSGNDNANPNSSRLFSKRPDGDGNVTQTVTINVTVNEDQESDIVGCFRACFGCLGSTAKSAAGA